MSRSGHQDIEEGNHPDDHPEQSQSAPNQLSQSTQGELNFGDSSEPLFSIYSKNAEEEDNKTAERWQKDADGVLIFTGLFSAAVATLLSVSVQDLRPNSQDTSAFYLANIFQVLADPNVTASHTSIPTPLTQPPPFSPQRYAVWVNSLWFLSLVISLTSALLATSLHQWARRYIRLTQPARCSPEKQARRRAFFASGVDKMHFPWAVEVLPALIHLSLFLFFSGLVIFLLNINHSVFRCVIWWIGLFATVYGCVTLMPMFWPHSPYYTPLSTPAPIISGLIAITIIIFVLPTIFLLAGIVAALFATARTGVRNIISNCTGRSTTRIDTDSDPSSPSGIINRFILRLLNIFFLNRLSQWDIERVAEKITSSRSSEVDLGILRWTLGALGEDDKLEEFFDSIPGFFNSELVKVPKMDFDRNINDIILSLKFRDALNGFLRRTLSSNSIIESVKNRRLDIYLNAVNSIFEPRQVFEALSYILTGNCGQLPPSIETAYTLARWCTANNGDIALVARFLVASVLQAIQIRDDRWIALARDRLGFPEDVFPSSIAQGDNSFAFYILVHMTPLVIRTKSPSGILSSLSKFDIHDTHPGLQNKFCALWNEIILKARVTRYPYVPVLRSIRQLYIALHQGTDAAPTAFDASTADENHILRQPSSYPLCTIATHHPNSAVPHLARLDHPSRLESQPIPSDSTAPREASAISGLASSPDYAHPAQWFPSASSPIDTVHTPPQVPSVTVLAIHESIQTVTTLDLNRLVSMEVSHPSPEPSLSTANLTTNIVRNEWTPDIPINEMEETSETPATTLFASPHPTTIPAAIAPSVVPRPPSVSVEQPDSSTRRDTATPHATSDISQTLPTTNQNLQSIVNIGATLRLPTSDGSSTAPPTIVSSSPSSPIMMSAVHSDTTV